MQFCLALKHLQNSLATVLQKQVEQGKFMDLVESQLKVNRRAAVNLLGGGPDDQLNIESKQLDK